MLKENHNKQQVLWYWLNPIYEKCVGFRTEICRCLSLFIYTLLLSNLILLSCPDCVSSCFGRDYNAKCHRDILVSLFFLLKGYSVSSVISSILRRCILSLNPHTQHLCLFSHLCRAVVGEKSLCTWGQWRDMVDADDSEGSMSGIATLSAVGLIIFISFGTVYISKHNVRTPAVLARCDEN